jgi:N-acetyl-anhydromuramoyl-L-alanine amidase
MSASNKKHLILNHRLQGVRYLESQNQEDRPQQCAVELLVIHNISLPPGIFGGRFVDELFCNQLDSRTHPYFAEIAKLRVSAHLFIDRAGEVTQYVPFNRKAWHAGASSFCGRNNCNDYSIGVELEGTDRLAFSDAQYTTLVEITVLLIKEYPGISISTIVGHSDIAPGRKTDPGPCFDWDRYRSEIRQTSGKNS